MPVASEPARDMKRAPARRRRSARTELPNFFTHQTIEIGCAGNHFSPRLSGVASGAASLGLRGLDLAVLRWRVRDELAEQARAHRGDLVDGALESLAVHLRGLREPADLADVLQRGCADLVLAGRGFE